MKTIFTYSVVPFLILVLLSGCGNDPAAKRMPSLKETYSPIDKKPFGAYVSFHLMTMIYEKNLIRIESNNFEESDKNLAVSGSNYICITRNLYTTDDDVTGIINFAKKGNDVFIAAAKFEFNFLKKLECELNAGNYLFENADQRYVKTGVKINYRGIKDTSMHQYFYRPFSQYFSSFNNSNTRVLGINENGDPDYIVILKGKGRIFLHCDPRAFSNYFLLQKDNYQYLQKVMGFLHASPDHVYWNNYYAAGKNIHNDKDNNSFSSLSEILQHPPLAMAFWLSVFLLMLYILYSAKRRQRIIPVVKPNENTTLAFTETIGRLYLQKKDNKNIADKQVTYFNEYIRNNYFLNTNIINDDFITTLSRKSGVPREKIDSLYRSIGHVQSNTVVDDYQLLSLNEQIQNFYKTIK